MASTHNEQLLDSFYREVTKEVLSGVERPHGGQLKKNLEQIWLGFMAESRALQPPSPVTVVSAPALSASRMVTIWLRRSLEYGPGKIPFRVPAHTLKRGPSQVLLVQVLESQLVKDVLTQPLQVATKVLQEIIDEAFKSSGFTIPQLDGQDDDSTDEDDDYEDEQEVSELDGDQDQSPDADESCEVDSDDDDVSFDLDENAGGWSALFETDNVFICQYSKIGKQGKNWVFKLENGVMHVDGRDYIFKTADGSAKW